MTDLLHSAPPTLDTPTLAWIISLQSRGFEVLLDDTAATSQTLAAISTEFIAPSLLPGTPMKSRFQRIVPWAVVIGLCLSSVYLSYWSYVLYSRYPDGWDHRPRMPGDADAYWPALVMTLSAVFAVLLAVIGATIAGVALWRRSRQADG